MTQELFDIVDTACTAPGQLPIVFSVWLVLHVGFLSGVSPEKATTEARAALKEPAKPEAAAAEATRGELAAAVPPLQALPVACTVALIEAFLFAEAPYGMPSINLLPEAEDKRRW